MAAHAHLGEDAPDGPHVDRGRVVPRAEQHLGRAVPQRHDLSRKFRVIHIASRSLRATCTNLMRICPHGNAERASESEVGELEVVIFIDQKILRLEVAVEDPARVQLGERDDLRRVCMTSDIGEKTRGEGGHVPAARHISERRPRRCDPS